MFKTMRTKVISAIAACAITVTATVAAFSFNAPQASAASTDKMEKAIEWAVGIANDNSHGYSQTNRWGPDYDCSSLVITALNQAGYNTNGATYTGNMRSCLTASGFTWIPWSQIGSMSNLKRGDILLNEASHVVLYLGDGKIVGANSNRGYPQTGDQTGTEISTQNFYSYPWNGVLRAPTSSVPNVANKTFMISSAVNSNLTFDVYGGLTDPAAETPIISYPQHGNPNQQFKFTPVGDKFRISPLSDTTGSMGLNIYAARRMGILQTYRYSGAQNELFWLEDAGSGYVYIRCMDGALTLEKNSSEAYIYLDTMNYSTNNQKWKLTEVSTIDASLRNQLKEDMRTLNAHPYNISYYNSKNTNASVIALQRLLNYFTGSNLDKDGICGSATERAIRAFQQKYNLSNDGIIGPASKQKMNELVSAL